MIKYLPTSLTDSGRRLSGIDNRKVDIMKRLIIKTFAAASLIFSAQAALACDYPERAEIPDGVSASKEEMLAGQNSVKNYVATMEAYLDCIVEQEKAARAEMEELEPEDEQLRDDLLNKKYNAAVEEMEKTAAQFNEQVQAYKARQE